MLFPNIKFRVIVDGKFAAYERVGKDGRWVHLPANEDTLRLGAFEPPAAKNVHREIFLRKDTNGQDVYEGDIIRNVNDTTNERVVYFDKEKDLIFSPEFIEVWEKCGSVRERSADDVIEGKFRWHRKQCKDCKFGKRNFGSNNLNCSGFDSERPGSRWPRPKFHPEDPSADHWFPISFNPRWMISKCARRQQKIIK